ncbi:MAG: amidohydrolase [Oscillospiraceae bacterium]|nr:amidohydrolase [Oscillospiraceae bacterium]
MNAIFDSICKYIEDNSGIFTDISKYIWENPELSLKEYKACAKYAEVLEMGGFKVERNVCGIKTAVSGTFGSGHPIIGILGEYDALSGLSQKGCVAEREAIIPNGDGHGCGHNMLGAGSLAAAFAIKNYLETTGKEGTVIFYGCPGEEGGSAKAFMAREDLFRGLDAAFCWHPADVNEVATGTNNSSVQVLYKFHGVSAHAAGDPENGRSALDAVELMNIGCQYLREHMKTECRVHYAMINGGGYSPNVVQAEASVLYMVRSVKVKDSLELLARVDKIAEGAALMTETTLERVFIDGTANCVPNFALEHLMYECFNEIGVPEHTDEEKEFACALKATYNTDGIPGTAARYSEAAAAYVKEQVAALNSPFNDFLMPEYNATTFSPGSTDVGDVSWQCPTAQVYVTCFPSGNPGHSWQNVSCGASSIGEKGLLHAGKVLAATAAKIYENPELLSDAKKEFAERTAEGYSCPIPKGVEPIALEF